MQAFDEDSHAVPTVDFDYDALDNVWDSDQGKLERSYVTGQATIDDPTKEIGFMLMRTLLRWVFKDAMKDSRGLKIRAALACWPFLPELKPLSMSDLARGFGMDKQSFGRWHDDFKKQFPYIKTPHMR